MQELEESCVPSYLHPNPLAAGVAWWRLFAAVDMYKKLGRAGPVLDFGAGSGELRHLLGTGATEYAFIEADERLAQRLEATSGEVTREVLDSLPDGKFAAIFALDALEHNEDVGSIIDALSVGLRADGILVISGPTENALYRLGRRIAGFSGHYHVQNIHQIEAIAEGRLRRLDRRRVPFGVPLFSLSVWGRPGTSRAFRASA